MNIPKLLEDNKTENGGYTKEFLASIGVSWPPPKGWKKQLMTKHDDWSWKPDCSVTNIAKHRNKTETRRLKKRISSEKKRDDLLKYYGLHKYSSWTAIAEMICNERGVPIPTSKSACRRLCLKYNTGTNNQKREHKPRLSSEKFYNSTAWREVRYIALKRSGGSCMLCGAKASDGIQLHVDHVTPRSVDPRKELDLDNLQVLCEDCNLGKSNRDEIDWRW